MVVLAGETVVAVVVVVVVVQVHADRSDGRRETTDAPVWKAGDNYYGKIFSSSTSRLVLAAN